MNKYLLILPAVLVAQYISAQALTKSGGVVKESNIITLKVGAVTYPNTNGTDGQVLTTNGTRTASWVTPSAGGSSGRMVLNMVTIEYFQLNNYDLSNVSILFVKVNSSWTSIYGFSGGVLGQFIHIYSVNNQTSNCCSGLSLYNFDDVNNDGNQKFIAPGGINIDSNEGTSLVFDGTYWRVSKLGGM